MQQQRQRRLERVGSGQRRRGGLQRGSRLRNRGLRRAGRDRHAAGHLRGQQEPRIGLSVRRPPRARLPRRHVRPEGRADRRSRHQARERGRRLLRRRRAEGRHDAGCRPPARGRHRHQLLERLAGCRGQDLLGQGHHDHLALGHEPGADHGGYAPAVLLPHRAQRPDPGGRGLRLRAAEAEREDRGDDPRREPVHAGPHRRLSRPTSRPAAARSRPRTPSTARTRTSSPCSPRSPRTRRT